MIRQSAALATCGLLFVANAVQAEVNGHINEHGKIVVNVTPETNISSLWFSSPAGNLIPVPPGDLTAPSAPFGFLAANDAHQVLFASLSSAVKLDGDWVTSVGYQGDPTSDLIAAWGDGTVSRPFPVRPIPEPSSGVLAICAAFALVAGRRRKR